ncbi:ribosomal RNA small subunit methyltransferase A [Tamaricihabitans halophyticus]|nr:rRNA adenine N(6)-methyltransferase family protein [Tamaricihabitans halophyticus]
MRESDSAGVHFLTSPRTATALVRAARVGAGDLVVEFGPGSGAITAPLLRTGATVLAIERDERFVRQLRHRFANSPGLRLRQADIREFTLPRKGFTAVANIPFGLSTVLLRRLLDPPNSGLRGASLLVEWGFAKRLTAARPRDLTTAWWRARFELTLVNQVPAAAFSPQPRVNAAHLLIRPRAGTRPGNQRVLWLLLSTAYRTPSQHIGGMLRAITGDKPHRWLRPLRPIVHPGTPAQRLTPAQWAELAERIAAERAGEWPRLPPRLWA